MALFHLDVKDKRRHRLTLFPSRWKKPQHLYRKMYMGRELSRGCRGQQRAEGMWCSAGRGEQMEEGCKGSRELCETEQGRGNMGHTFCCVLNPSLGWRQPRKMPYCSSVRDVGKPTAQQSMLKQLRKPPEKQITESVLLLKNLLSSV